MNRNRITIHHIELSKTGLGISGGEVCLLELVKNFKNQFNQIIYVPENGKTTYERNGINLEYVVISPFWIEKVFGVYISYLLRTLFSSFKVRRFKNDRNVIISHSDFLPAVFYAFLIKLRNPSAKWIAFMHMVAPNPFKDYKGEFTNNYCFPKFNLICYNISQWIFNVLANWKADKIIFINPYYKKYIYENNLQKKSIILKYGGLSNSIVEKKNRTPNHSNALYDGVFLGRFHPQKGIFDLVDIWSEVVKHNQNAKLAIIGSGEKSFTDKLKHKIDEKNLNKNILLLGYKENKDKFEILKSSKIFLFPSYFESFGIAIVEAMSCGLPIVAYDLPVYHGVFTEGMIRVPIKNKDLFAEEVVNLLEDIQHYNKIGEQAFNLSEKFSWKKFSVEIKNIIDPL